ncbi:MAG: DNA phosphorothioation-associated DGQHR protein 1 [Nitrospira sp.]|nr:DNA phosphorothioation-associated DGQHR protein 1 [Nitrospira sp.]
MPIDFPVRTPVLKVVQPLGEYFAAVLPAELLLQVTYSDPLRILGFSESGDYELKGHQRKLVKERLRTIGRFIDTVEAAFPNSIILAANYNESGELVEDEAIRWSVEFNQENEAVGTLIIPSAAQLAAIVDGQHRLYGFKEVSLDERRAMPLLTAIYLDLPNPFQAYLFATINYNQKPVDKSQTYELYGFNLEEEPPEAWSPEKTAVFLCRKLNTDPTSPIKDHIIVAAQSDAAVEIAAKAQKKSWAVSTATVVEGLLRLFSSNPKRDRDLMHRKEAGKGRERKLLAMEAAQDRTPLRQCYLESNDLLIFTLTKNYFRAVNEILWKTDNRSYIRKTVGVQALFDILRLICPDAIAAKDVSEQFFARKLAPCGSINFADDFFQASGTGRQRIRNTLELKLGLKTLTEINEADRPAYERICGWK